MMVQLEQLRTEGRDHGQLPQRPWPAPIVAGRGPADPDTGVHPVLGDRVDRTRSGSTPRPMMPARWRATRGRGDPPMPGRDDGFILLETLVSVTMIGILMTALTAFYASSAAVLGRQSGTQAAAQVATSRLQEIRALDPALITSGSSSVTIGGLTYTSSWVSTCAGRPLTRLEHRRRARAARPARGRGPIRSGTGHGDVA